MQRSRTGGRAAWNMVNAACVVACAGLAAGSAAGADFVPVAPLPGGQVSVVSGFSPDGAGVVGASRLSPGDAGIAIRFDLLGRSTTSLGSTTNIGVAATDGLGLIVGNGPAGPFRVQSGVTQGVNLGSFAAVADMSADGRVLVGNNLNGAFLYDNNALTFAGSVVNLGKLAGIDGPFDSMIVTGISADGSRITGTASRFIAGDDFNPDGFEFMAAWRSAAGTWARVFPSAGPGSQAESYAEAASPTGAFIVGYARVSSDGPFLPFVYTVSDGTVVTLPTDQAGFASAVLEVPGPNGPLAYVGGQVDTPAGPRAVVWEPTDTGGTVTYTRIDLTSQVPAEFAGWRLTSVLDMVLPPGATAPRLTGAGVDPDGHDRAWVFDLATSQGCLADYNRDGFVNLDDLGDYVTDYYTQPAIPGGLQPEAPSYSDIPAGFGVACANAGDAPAPYDVNAYRQFGFRVAYSSDGSNSCPFDPSQSFPNLDHLGDFLTMFYGESLNPSAACAN